MRKYIVLLLITGTAWAQTELDKLVLKDGAEYFGKYLKKEKELIYFNQFKSKNERLARIIPLRDVQAIQLVDGTFIIDKKTTMGVNSNEKIDFTAGEKAVYNAKKDAQKWLAYPPLALISASGLATTTFFLGEGILDMSDETILFPSIFGGSLGLIGSYHLFNKLDKKNFEVTKTKDIESYGKRYSRDYKDRKLKNIIIGSSLAGLTTVIVLYFISKGSEDAFDGPYGFPAP
tara:strand:+ start:115 stop:810 length:696 start_codon:yes stop_codon:yes gene_type:complete